MLNQFPLCLNVIDIIFLRLFLRRLLILLNRCLETVHFLVGLFKSVEWLYFGILFKELQIIYVCPRLLLLHKRSGLLLGHLQKSALIDFDFIDSVLDVVLELSVFKLLFC